MTIVGRDIPGSSTGLPTRDVRSSRNTTSSQLRRRSNGFTTASPTNQRRWSNTRTHHVPPSNTTVLAVVATALVLCLRFVVAIINYEREDNPESTVITV